MARNKKKIHFFIIIMNNKENKTKSNKHPKIKKSEKSSSESIDDYYSDDSDNKCNPSIIEDIADDLIKQVQNICSTPKYSKKINHLLSHCVTIIFKNISPYLYIIISILIIMFLMNCFQFYYYVKLFIDNSKRSIPTTIPSSTIIPSMIDQFPLN